MTDWYEEHDTHLFDDIEKAADAEAEAILEEDRALRAAEQADQPQTQPGDTP
jgi:hypothetical protein